MNTATVHRLEGFEPDNLLAFMALLGLIRAIETADQTLRPRASWDFEKPPLRPRLHVTREMTQEAIAECAGQGVERLSAVYEFDGLPNLKLTQQEARRRLFAAAQRADPEQRRASGELWAALVSDGAVKEREKTVVRTPLCFLDAGQTGFLKTLAAVCKHEKKNNKDAIAEALFHSWNRSDKTPSFRWDPVEDSRHAYRWTAPEDDKQGVEHGANVLAAVGLPLLTVVPVQNGSSVGLRIIGGGEPRERISFVWPVWRESASLAAIRALLSHPGTRDRGSLDHLGVDHFMIAWRISPSKYMSVTRARPLA